MKQEENIFMKILCDGMKPKNEVGEGLAPPERPPFAVGEGLAPPERPLFVVGEGLAPPEYFI